MSLYTPQGWKGVGAERSEKALQSKSLSSLLSARQSRVLDGRRRASSRKAEDWPQFGSRQLKRRREDTSEEPKEGEWRVHMRQRRRRMLPCSAEIETDLDSVGEPEADEDPRRSPRDQGTTLFDGRDAPAFLVERQATLQSYLRTAVLENTARYNRIESDESTYERWTRKMLFVGNNADVKDMLSTTNPVPRGIPLLIQGGLKYPFDDEFGTSPIE
ncbi:hypothetical protein KVT40_003137 [Elsinoe batatas]|uniref:Uncharacterized protein n=1 Tax=Elsinoe batatas TaxID=2601811 RepID=A0A8K0L4Y9_9PEZI|nr:hypothetical protein KVT40_003137 [Elsinoe batatas]